MLDINQTKQGANVSICTELTIYSAAQLKDELLTLLRASPVVNVNLAQGIDSDPPMDIFIEFDNDGVPTAEPGGGQRTILVNFFSVVFNGGWFDALTGETDNTAMTISWHRPTGVLNIEFPNEYLGAGEITVSVSSIHRLPESTCDGTESGLFSLK